MITTYAFVFARGGSKGVPRKNIRPFAGKPLIAHTIELALSLPSISEVIVSTEDHEIAEVAAAFGAQVPFLRPAELAGDHSPEWSAWRHAVSFVRDEMGKSFDRFISLPATSPLRTAADVTACLERYDQGDADMVIGLTPAASNPYFNMVSVDVDGRVRLLLEPPSGISRRQDAPEIFDIAPCAYVTSPDFVMTNLGIFDGALKAVTIPGERAVDIDTVLDFEFAEFLFLRQQETQR